MIETSFQVLLADYTNRSILLADIPSGKITCEIPHTPSVSPVSVVLTGDKKTAYIPSAGDNGSGLLFALSLDSASLYQLPLTLPHPAQFALAPDAKTAYLAAINGQLFQLDLTTLALKQWGQMPDDACCTGIAASPEQVFTIWQYAEGGSLVVFDTEGHLQKQLPLPGIPTCLVLTAKNQILITYSAGALKSEGLVIFPKPDKAASIVVTIQCAECRRGVKVYPNYLVLSPDQTLAYVVNEDSSSLTTVDINRGTVTGCIPVGHSLSQITLSPDGRFAVGASNVFADLCLIDLVNRRLLSVTDTGRELSGFIASA